jgi:hypothetical protein
MKPTQSRNGIFNIKSNTKKLLFSSGLAIISVVASRLLQNKI